jgi:hypothetical protein
MRKYKEERGFALALHNSTHAKNIQQITIQPKASNGLVSIE